MLSKVFFFFQNFLNTICSELEMSELKASARRTSAIAEIVRTQGLTEFDNGGLE